MLDKRSKYLRKLILRMIEVDKRGHLGSAMSIVEICRVLYDEILNYKSNNPDYKNRDIFILSKGHGCLALYALLADKGFFPKKELDTFCKSDSILGGHPEYGKIPGVEISSGALGHGLPIGVGMAIAIKLKKQSRGVYVLTGDGEINEGSTWEAAMAASKHSLYNLTILVDYNKMQSYGKTSQVMNLEPLADKWKSFGFQVSEVDGHNINELKTSLTKLNSNIQKPKVVICHTVKGKGIPLAENNPLWHHKSKITDQEINQLYTFLEN